VRNFNELSRRHGTDTIHNLIRLLHKLGADESQYRVYKERIEQARIAEEKRKEQERLLVLDEIRKRIAKFQNCISTDSSHILSVL